jgi:pimeloyl-ACP methyl ester carboxylesterase
MADRQDSAAKSLTTRVGLANGRPATGHRPAPGESRIRRLALERSGSGEPLVLIHGIGATQRVWDPIRPALAQYHDVISLDLPGFGSSPPLPAGITPSAPALADAIAAELDELDVADVHVVGNSMGGQLALELASRSRAKSVVALAPTGGWSRLETYYVRLILSCLRAGARMSGPANVITRSGPGRRASFWFLNSRGERIPPRAAAAAIRAFAAAPAFDETKAWFINSRVRDLPWIACPVTIAWGTRDRLLFSRQGRSLAAAIPGARLVEMNGVGHAPMSDDPDLVARIILEGVRAPARA